MTIWIVQHSHEMDADREDVKLIGAYSSRASAEAAVGRLSSRPGFREHAGGFHIGEYELDKDHWTEGFVTLS